MFNSHINSNFDFRIIDESGENLLQGENPYTLEDINLIFYDKEKKPQPVYDPLLGAPKKIIINDSDWIRIFLNTPEEKNTVTHTYIQFGSYPVDTIKAEWTILDNSNAPTYGGGGYTMKRIWFNDELIIENENLSDLPQIIRLRKEISSDNIH